jgi:predicted ATPase
MRPSWLKLYLFSLMSVVDGDDPFAQMDRQIKQRRTLEAIKRILLRESLNQPLMIVFEDLHWIDGETQTLLNLLADSIGTAKILLLVNYRPDYSDQWNSKTYYTRLRLDPLGRESADEMLAALLGSSEELAALKRLIVDKTQGNPFFMEEIVQGLFEQGALARNGGVKLAKSLHELTIPSTVQAMLAARIDRLTIEEKELLQTLAVLGREFPVALVKRVTLKPDDDLERMLSRLQAGELIYEQLAPDDVEYTFKHAVTQEVAYNGLLVERRKLLHERAAQALESMFAQQLNDHVDELAHHYSLSGNDAKAVEYLVRAGDQAHQRSTFAEAAGYFEAALKRLKELPLDAERDRWEIAICAGLADVTILTSGYAAAEYERHLTRRYEIAERLGDATQLFFSLVECQCWLPFGWS